MGRVPVHENVVPIPVLADLPQDIVVESILSLVVLVTVEEHEDLAAWYVGHVVKVEQVLQLRVQVRGVAVRAHGRGYVGEDLVPLLFGPRVPAPDNNCDAAGETVGEQCLSGLLAPGLSHVDICPSSWGIRAGFEAGGWLFANFNIFDV